MARTLLLLLALVLKMVVGGRRCLALQRRWVQV
jgi:hypothetical protein